MSDKTALTVHGTNPTGLTEAQWQMVTDTYMKGATAEEAQVFRMVAERAGLDPWKKQIHAVKRWDSKEGRNVWTFQTGIDGYTAIAHRSGLCAGIEDAVFDPADESTPTPRKATVTVWRMVKGQRQPFTASARWSEYAQTGTDKKTGQTYLTGLWKKMPYGQLAKCARALALRLAFPEETSGIYVDAEMDQADNPEGHAEQTAPQRATPATEPEEIPQQEPPPAKPSRRQQAAEAIEAEVVAAPAHKASDLAKARAEFDNELWREVPVPPEMGIEVETLGQIKRNVDRDVVYMKARGDLRHAADLMAMTEIRARVANNGRNVEDFEDEHGSLMDMPSKTLINILQDLRQKKTAE